jgi:transcriptional regulator with GAF, ATPase, and Fis domain
MLIYSRYFVTNRFTTFGDFMDEAAELTLLQAFPASAIPAILEVLVASMDAALGRVWLLGPGDSCGTCAMRPECPDQTRCLHLSASAGLTERIDGAFRRFPIGARHVGQVMVTRRPFLASERLEDLGLAEPAWLAAHRIAGFAAFPLEHADSLEGVLVIFARRPLSAEDERRLLRGAGRMAHAAVAARAHVTLAATCARLAAENAALQKALRIERALLRSRDGAAVMADATGDPGEPAAPTSASFAGIQREAIERTLAETNGRISGPHGAAARLGMKPTTLESRMKKLGVRRPGRR